MAAVFEGLVFTEQGQPLSATSVGGESFYVIDDHGFRHHLRARELDGEILRGLWGELKGHEEEVAEQAMKMLGQEDIFTKAVLQRNMENPDAYLDQVMEHGLPEQARLWMGMMGFRVVVNYRGEVVRIEQPGRSVEEE
ncbi:MAG: hypothetical protein ABSB61_13340 [Anaerolineales bacterium]|jgi:hypothetical protein